MRNRTLRSSIVIVAAAALSALAITCRTTDSLGPSASTVELRQVQQFAYTFNRIIDQGIANRVAGLDDVDICPIDGRGQRAQVLFDNNVSIIRDEAVRGPKADDPGVKFTIVQLQELRALVNLRVDEAFRAGANTAAYRDLLSVKISGNSMSGKVNAPRGTVQISEAQ
jgi:hypothetical protein